MDKDYYKNLIYKEAGFGSFIKKIPGEIKSQLIEHKNVWTGKDIKDKEKIYDTFRNKNLSDAKMDLRSKVHGGLRKKLSAGLEEARKSNDVEGAIFTQRKIDKFDNKISQLSKKRREMLSGKQKDVIDAQNRRGDYISRGIQTGILGASGLTGGILIGKGLTNKNQ